MIILISLIWTQAFAQMTLQLKAFTDAGTMDTCVDSGFANRQWYPTFNGDSDGTYSIAADGTCIDASDNAHRWRFYCVSTDLLYVRLLSAAGACTVGSNTLNDNAGDVVGEGFIVNTVSACNTFYNALGRDRTETIFMGNIDGAGALTCGATYFNFLTVTTFDCSSYVGDFPGMTALNQNGGLTCIGTPSARPSSRPSSRPSDRPTSSPSSGRPTSNPTQAPTTPVPSSNPTTKPSLKPTGQPTSKPSNFPSPPPSTLPSSGPTNKPTGHPSNKPTAGPSPPPTIVPTPPPTSPSQAPSTQGPSNMPSPSPTVHPSVKPNSDAPTHRPSVNPTQPSLNPSPPPTSPTPPPTPPPVSSSPSPNPSSAVPTPPPTPPPISSSPSPPPSPAPTSAAPTMTDAPTTSPPSPSPTAATFHTVVNQSHGGQLKSLGTPATRPIRAICSEGGWGKLNKLVNAGRQHQQDIADWAQWKHQTSSTNAPKAADSSEVDHTTAAPLGRLVTTEKSYAHPFSTTTKKPDYTADRFSAMEVIVDTGEEEYDILCAKVNAYTADSDKIGPALASVWFDEQTLLPEVAPITPFLDMWKSMYASDVARDTNLALHEILVTADNQMQAAFEAACNHKHSKFDHIDTWGKAWKSHAADHEYMVSIGEPLIHWDMTDAQERDVAILSGFYAMTSAQQDAVCAVGNSKYPPSNPMNLEAFEQFWDAADLIPSHDPNFYVARIARLQKLSAKKVQSLTGSPPSLLKAFAMHPETAKQECDATLADVHDVVVDIWDTDHMDFVVEAGKRLDYQIRQCHTVEEDEGARKAEERKLFVRCNGAASWNADHTVGGSSGDISLATFTQELAGCYDDVASRLGQFFNKAKVDENKDGKAYCANIRERLSKGQSVALGDFAWWEFGTVDPWFECLEDFKADVVHHEYTNNALRACSILSQVDQPVFTGLATALENVQEQNMIDMRNYIDGVYSKKVVESKTGWVTVTKRGNTYESEYVPSVQIVAKALSAKTKETFAKDVQQIFNIGLATDVIKGDDDVFTAKFDQPLDEVQPRIKWLAEIQTQGLDGYEIKSIAFAPHFPTLLEAFKEVSGVDADEIQYVCALNPNADGVIFRSEPRPQVEQTEPVSASDTEEPRTEAPAPATNAPVASVAPAQGNQPAAPEPTVSETGNSPTMTLATAGALLAAIAFYY